MIYKELPTDEMMSQGDIIDNCPMFQLREDSNPIDLSAPVLMSWHARAIILTQACDIAQEKTKRILVAPLQKTEEIVESGDLKASTIRDHVRRGLVHGWYFLPTAPSPIELPESLIDLRTVQTMPRGVLEHLIVQGNRICRLATPYREHLAQHFAVTYSRIGLPEPLESE